MNNAVTIVRIDKEMIVATTHLPHLYQFLSVYFYDKGC